MVPAMHIPNHADSNIISKNCNSLLCKTADVPFAQAVPFFLVRYASKISLSGALLLLLVSNGSQVQDLQCVGKWQVALLRGDAGLGGRISGKKSVFEKWYLHGIRAVLKVLNKFLPSRINISATVTFSIKDKLYILTTKMYEKWVFFMMNYK